MTSPTLPPRRAVALSYNGHAAPRVVAKGEGPVAERILDVAARHDVPVTEDPILTLALGTVELDTPIPTELYQAVAIVIGAVLAAGRRSPLR